MPSASRPGRWSGATLAFDGGKYTLAGGTYNVSGRTLVAGGSLVVNAAVAAGKSIAINGGT